MTPSSFRIAKRARLKPSFSFFRQGGGGIHRGGEAAGVDSRGERGGEDEERRSGETSSGDVYDDCPAEGLGIDDGEQQVREGGGGRERGCCPRNAGQPRRDQDRAADLPFLRSDGPQQAEGAQKRQIRRAVLI